MIRTREFCKKTVTEELRPGDVVQHFKRGMTNSDDHNAYLYKIICEAIHTETKEPMVVYQALYGDCATYVRPKEMFLEKVDTKKYPDATQEYRFEKYAGIPRLKSEKEIPRELKHSPISLRMPYIPSGSPDSQTFPTIPGMRSTPSRGSDLVPCWNWIKN